MNLGQAYQGWSQQSQNRDLYVKTREAFRKAWFTLPTNMPCSYYTLEVLGKALAETRVIESFKVNAASVMIHVLTFAAWAEPKYNPLPDFTIHELMEYTKGPLADPDKIKPAQKREAEEVDDTDLNIDPVTGEPRKAEQESIDTIKVREYLNVPTLDINRLRTDTVPEPCDEHGNALPDDDSRDDPLENIDFDKQEETKTEDMKEKKTRGKQPRKVCQIDPETLEVVKTYDSINAGCTATGAKNMDRAIKKLQLAAGYYWQYPEDMPTFADRIAAKRKSEHETEQPHIVASDALEVFTDDELMEELDRRGWIGELKRVQIVTLGGK